MIPVQPELDTPEARDWWDSLVSAPWAEKLTATDWQTARRGAKLVDLFWTEPTSQLAGEIRQIEAKLGMTVADRDRLGWNIEPPPSPEPGDQGAAAKPSRRRPDPRQ